LANHDELIARRAGAATIYGAARRKKKLIRGETSEVAEQKLKK